MHQWVEMGKVDRCILKVNNKVISIGLQSLLLALKRYLSIWRYFCNLLNYMFFDGTYLNNTEYFLNVHNHQRQSKERYFIVLSN